MIESKAQAMTILQDTSQSMLDREHAIHYLRERTLEPNEIEALVVALQDEISGVRWAAGTVLAAHGKAVLPALLRALSQAQGDTLLRASAHHVLHDNVNPEVRHASKALLQALRGPGADVATIQEAGQWLQQLTAAAN